MECGKCGVDIKGLCITCYVHRVLQRKDGDTDPKEYYEWAADTMQLTPRTAYADMVRRFSQVVEDPDHSAAGDLALSVMLWLFVSGFDPQSVLSERARIAMEPLELPNPEPVEDVETDVV